MRLSTRTRYGSRAMAEIAAVYPDATVSVKEMAQNQHLSPKYLEHIMRALKAAGLIKPVRGMRGGYALTRSPASIKLSEIFCVLEGSPAPVFCVDHPKSCPIRKGCPTRQTWIELKNAITEVLEGTTLEDLAKRMKRKERKT